MPFAVVCTRNDNGEAEYFYCPETWIEGDNLLWWPPSKLLMKLQNNELSQRDHAWTSEVCIVKRAGLSRKDASNMLDVFLNANTDNEDILASQYLENQRSNRGSKRKRNADVEVRDFNADITETISSGMQPTEAIYSGIQAEYMEPRTFASLSSFGESFLNSVATNNISNAISERTLIQSILEIVTELKRDIAEIKEDHSKLKQSQAELKYSQAELKHSQSELKQSQSAILKEVAAGSVKLDKLLNILQHSTSNTS
ncbi:hypothetical protein DMENIID0001_104400 [Sergentomyia squamirostris]